MSFWSRACPPLRPSPSALTLLLALLFPLPPGIPPQGLGGPQLRQQKVCASLPSAVGEGLSPWALCKEKGQEAPGGSGGRGMLAGRENSAPAALGWENGTCRNPLSLEHIWKVQSPLRTEMGRACCPDQNHSLPGLCHCRRRRQRKGTKNRPGAS